jgi:hypothetical protein
VNPPRSILNPAFRYVPSHQTNIAETFKRIRNEQQAAELKKANVQTIKRRSA